MSLSCLVACSLLVCPADAASLPGVGSGTLVAHFVANNGTVTTDKLGRVSSWRATNDNSIELHSIGDDSGNIRYHATGMNGLPTIEVIDPGFASDNQVLRGAIPGTRTATTVFWLGFYDPGRDGISDGSGLYAYSYGTDGADGSQLDHQMDSGDIELFGGAGTQAGSSIAALDSQYTIWRTFYGVGTAAGHAAFANGIDLGLPTPNGGDYSVSGDLQLFGYQNSSGESGGFNFLGNMSELLIYDGILNSTDVAAVEAYLAARRDNLPASPVPEPSSLSLAAILVGFLALRTRRGVR